MQSRYRTQNAHDKIENISFSYAEQKMRNKLDAYASTGHTETKIALASGVNIEYLIGGQ